MKPLSPRPRALALWTALALAACTTDDPAGLSPDAGDAETPDGHTAGDSADTRGTPASFRVRGTVEQIYVWKAPAGAGIEVVDPEGEVIASGTTDDLGSLVLRGLEPAEDLTVRLAGDPDDAQRSVTVLSVEGSQPHEEFYAAQQLVPGNNYLTMRDGTLLHAFVSLPGPVEEGPYPTIVNYSGYSPGRPGELLSPAAEVFCESFPILCNAPGHPAGLLLGIAGYATVGVNMRGTGCSGGAYDYFETLQLLDGYDVIEIVARQDWVKHNKVGMAGLSYPGITQLFVASTRPPSLAAIAPMSVIADSASSTLAPGGIFNDGFALAWVENVLEKSRPYGREWIQGVVDGGDTLCEEHQLLHDQMVDVVAKALANPFYTDEVAKPLDPSAFVHEIDVPVFLTGQWQDEQTGPHFAALLDKFTGSPHARFTVTNGVHTDGYTPQIMMEWKTFFDLYVAREVPSFDPQARALVPVFYSQSLGAALELPPNRFEGYTSYEEALADYEAEASLRVIWESGAHPDFPAGAPLGRFETFHDGWPVPETEPHRWYLQPDGGLGAVAPGEGGGASSFHHDPAAGIRTILTGSIEKLQPDWTYAPLEPGKAVAFITEPLAEDLVMLGHGSADLWIRSTAIDADLEVHLTEVRPDGQETLVQSGWLRASHRALREDATELRPVKTHREEDYSPLVPGEWTEVRVEIMPFGHIFRAGSQIRLSVDTPGDTTASWYFILLEQGDEVVHTVGHSAAWPSSVVLPVIPGVEVETDLPDCFSLRAQPCRTYEQLVNDPATE